MRTVSFTSLVNGILARLGLDPTQTPAPNTLSAIAEYVTSAVRTNQECYPWPDFEIIEQRQFYPSWSQTASYTPGQVVLGSDMTYYIAVGNSTGKDPTTYAATTITAPVTLNGITYYYASGTVANSSGLGNGYWIPTSQFHCSLYNAQSVYFPSNFVLASDGNYYYCVSAISGLAPQNDSSHTYWALVPSANINFNTGGILFAIPLAQTLNGVALTPIGEVIDVFAADPRTANYAAPIPWTLTSSGIVAVQNRVSAPSVPALVWIQYTTQPPTYTTANYNDGTTSVPYVIAEATKYHVLAMMHREDGQFDKGTVMDQLGRQYLDIEWDKLEMKQSQQGRFQSRQR
jgi:hypothetical protein